jgi:TRAP-type mannitol/chloroaromatic compound transport system permease small subunit
MSKLIKIARTIDLLNEWIGRLTVPLVLITIGVGVWNVIGRKLGEVIGENLTSNALIELQWYLFDLIFFLGAAYALKHNDHVRVDVFYRNLSESKRALIDFLGSILFLIPFCVFVIYYSWNTILDSWLRGEVSPDPGGLPRYPIKSFIIVSFILLILQGISQAIKNWLIWRGRSAEKHR